MGVGFAGEGHDCVGTDGGIGHAVADALDDAAVAVDGVAAAHGLEHGVVAALEGNVEVLAHLGQLGAGVDQPLGEVAGVAGGEANPLQAFDVMDAVQQVGEGVLAPPLGGDSRQVAAVGIDVLAQQGDLLESAGGQPLHLQPDGAGQARLLQAPHRGHHAVGAALVAAVDHIHPGADGAVAAGGGDVLEDVVLLRGHHLLALLHLAEQPLQAIGVLGTHHQVELGHAAQQRLPLLLGHAARHHQGEPGIEPLALGLAAQVAVDLLLGVVANRAGVVEHQIGAVFPLGLPVAHRFENSGHALGIRLVHLAAEGGDPIAAAPVGGAADQGGGGVGAGEGSRHRSSFGHGGFNRPERLSEAAGGMGR